MELQGKPFQRDPGQDEHALTGGGVKLGRPLLEYAEESVDTARGEKQGMTCRGLVRGLQANETLPKVSAVREGAALNHPVELG